MHACRPDGEKKTKCNKKFLCPLIFPVPAGAQKQNMQHVQSGVRNITRPAGGSFAQRAMRAWCSSIVFERLPARPVVIMAERLICGFGENPGVFCHHALRVSFERKATNSAHVAVDRTGYGSPNRQMARLASKVVSICSLAADSRQATLSRLSLKSPRSECI